MNGLKRTSLPVLVLLLGGLACVLPAAPLVDPNAAATSVAATVDAIIQMTNDAGEPVDVVASDTPTLVPSSTPTATGTLQPTFTLPPTLTPTFTSTPTLVASATPLVAMLSVSVPTNCRLGPGKIYRMVGALLAGQWVQTYARTADHSYWYIRNPDAPSQFCWVWGEYATLSGATGALPVYTPPPTPTFTASATPAPGFKAFYSGMDSCSGWWADIDLKNSGSLTFKSVGMTLRDTVTSETATRTTDGFLDKTNCSSSTAKQLLPGKMLTASAPLLPYNPHGHKLKVVITLCSNTGLNGTCITNSIIFTP